MSTINADKASLDEIHELLDLIHNDGSIHDLDQYNESQFGTLGAVLLGLMRREQEMRAALTGLLATARVVDAGNKAKFNGDCCGFCPKLFRNCEAALKVG